MKTSYKTAAVALMLGFAVQANAQDETATATATASATIIAPIQIANDGDMNFGDIIATTTGGIVVLSVDGERVSKGVQLPTAGTQGTAAQFTVTGTGSYTYDVSLPSVSYSIQTGAGGIGEVMEITNWTHNSTEKLMRGTETFNVGATLNVAADQFAGEYIGKAPFTVTVNYN